ncbi:MAG: hypothetical protein U9O98_00875 [Asgard group archaeon]|nr:hypothetical protein [Asgard group archaeon]
MSKKIIVCKIGGSLLERGSIEAIQQLGSILTEIHSPERKIIIISGGGPFAEYIRKKQPEFSLCLETAHWMAILGMTQYACLLHQVISNTKIVAYSSRVEFNKLKLPLKTIPILNTWRFMRTQSTLPKTWETTSDAIATEIAIDMEATTLLFLKDIDGIYINGLVEKTVTINQLLELEQSPLDKPTPILLNKSSLETYIINGFFPKRIKKVLFEKNGKFTEIVK